MKIRVYLSGEYTRSRRGLTRSCFLLIGSFRNEQSIVGGRDTAFGGERVTRGTGAGDDREPVGCDGDRHFQKKSSYGREREREPALRWYNYKHSCSVWGSGRLPYPLVIILLALQIFNFDIYNLMFDLAFFLVMIHIYIYIVDKHGNQILTPRLNVLKILYHHTSDYF